MMNDDANTPAGWTAAPLTDETSATERMPPEERARRWRLLLGGAAGEAMGVGLSGADAAMDQALAALYEAGSGGQGVGSGRASGQKKGGLGGSAPSVSRWLGDIRAYFPGPVVQLMQADAMERLGLKQLLLEPEMLREVTPDVHLVATLLTLNQVIPNKTRDTARQVVRQVVADLERRLASPLRQAVTGSLSRSLRTRRPRHSEIDWHRTILANLKHYQPSYRTIVPHTRIGYGRKGQSLRDIVLCIDQSGSMANSVVYASIMGAVLASIRAVETSLVLFDTAVVDLTPELHDPVEVLFGTQLGGGTDIHRALTYCQSLVRRPQETILVLITDLYEGGPRQQMLQRAQALVASGVQLITLLALEDSGAPSYDHDNAAALTAMGVPCFACTPDHFPGLMAAAIQRQDLGAWAAAQGIVLSRSR